MPERKKFSQPAEVVNQTLLLPDTFPSLPDSVEKRFGEDIANYQSETERWWSRTKRALIEGYQQTTIPQNETKKAVELLNSEFISGNTTLSARIDSEIIIRTTADSALAVRATALEASVNTAGTGLLARVSTVESTYATTTFAEAKKTEAITAALGNSAAQVLVESTARATADGFLAAKYTLQVAAGEVVTGINLTSATTGGTNFSGITFRTDNLSVVASTGSAVQLVALSASGFVFGTDVSSDGFVAGVSGWRVTKAGAAEFNDVTVRGAVFASSGTFAGSLSAATGTFAGSLSAATGTFAGTLSAASGTFTGSLSAATGTFAGSLSAASGTFAGSLSGASITGATGTFAGSLSGATITGATGTFSGTLDVGTGNSRTQINGSGITFGASNLVVTASGTAAVADWGSSTGRVRIVGSSINSTTTIKVGVNLDSVLENLVFSAVSDGGVYAKTLVVGAATTLDGTLTVAAATTLNSTLTVAAATTLNSALTVAGALTCTTVAAGTLTCTTINTANNNIDAGTGTLRSSGVRYQAAGNLIAFEWVGSTLVGDIDSGGARVNLVEAGVHTATTVTHAGYVTMNDSTGTPRKFMIGT